MMFELTWDPEMTEFYKHGSTVEYTKEGVRFENKMLSPGATIAQWISNPHYQGARGWLELPLLERGKSYQVKLEARSAPQSSPLLKVAFYNRSEESVGMDLITTLKDHFTYPKSAYSYQITLLNNGIEELHFCKIILQSYEGGSESVNEKAYNK